MSLTVRDLDIVFTTDEQRKSIPSLIHSLTQTKTLTTKISSFDYYLLGLTDRELIDILNTPLITYLQDKDAIHRVTRLVVIYDALLQSQPLLKEEVLEYLQHVPEEILLFLLSLSSILDSPIIGLSLQSFSYNIMHLPREILVNILLEIDIWTLVELSKTSKQFYNLLSSPDMLERIAIANNIPTPPNIEKAYEYKRQLYTHYLVIAAENSDLKSLKRLYEALPNHFEAADTLATLMMRNVKISKDIVLYLLDKGLSENSADILPNVFEWAMNHREFELAREIFEMIPLDDRSLTSDQLKSLTKAVEEGDYEVVEILLGYTVGRKRLDYLLERAINQGHTDVVRLLLEKGANYKHAMRDAVRKGDKDIIKLLEGYSS